MMDGRVLIVSKTKIGDKICVGGILENGKSVRLLDTYCKPHDGNTKIDIGHVYKITYQDRSDIIRPHTEDILVESTSYEKSLSKEDIVTVVKRRKLNVRVWDGNVNLLFDGYLNWTLNGKGYISKNEIPEMSTGFWLADKDLHWSDERYYYSNEAQYDVSIKFVGCETPLTIIHAGTLIRVSLSRWFKPSGVDYEGCWLQLSGWYSPC